MRFPLVLLLLAPITGICQPYYHDYISLAKRALDTGQYDSSATYYENAFQRYVGYGSDRVDYAHVLKIIGNEARCLEQLTFAIDSLHFHNYEEVLSNTCFLCWEQPGLYTSFLRKADSILAAHYSKFDTLYRNELLSLGIIDQQIRRAIIEIETSQLLPDTIVSKVWKAFRPIDSLNAERLQHLVSAYGYPDIDIVGDEANKAAWLIILHSDIHSKEILLPELQASCERGQSPMKYYAYVHDRLINQRGITETRFFCSGRKESDGVLYFRAENPSCVNLWRESVGLPPDEIFREYEPCSD